MRPIKFRAWFAPYNRYAEVSGDLALDYLGLSQSTSERQASFSLYNEENSKYWIFEQYTGLKDKNGVEIYEGDILNRVGINMVVRWNKISVGFDLAVCDDMDNLDRNWLFFSRVANTDYEVIGNIHQNKDLLK